MRLALTDVSNAMAGGFGPAMMLPNQIVTAIYDVEAETRIKKPRGMGF